MGIEIDNVKIVFTQKADDMQEGDMPQAIEIELTDAGGGKYFVLKTERWAIESIDEIAEMLNKIKSLE